MAVFSYYLRWIIAPAACLFINACASDGATIGDLLSGGPKPLAGDPSESGLVIVDIDLVLPESEMLDDTTSLMMAYPYLQNIQTKAVIKYTDERSGHVLFSNVPPGQYHFLMKPIYRYTFDKSEQYQKKRNRHMQRYDYQTGNVWRQIITVSVGEPVYHGQIAITPEHTETGISFGFSADEEIKQPPANVTLVPDAKVEKDVWNNYFLALYKNSVWADKVKQHLAQTE